MLLSIIIPYYKTLDHTKELLKVLEPQLDEDVELIIVDDGCNEKELDKYNAKVIHLPNNSGNASKPRNIGLDNATGKYIAFIDSDDMVSEHYIKTIKHYIEKDTDIIYLSWQCSKMNIYITEKPPKWNCSVWCRVYKREIIGNVRFDTNLKIAEDWKFNQEIQPKTSVAIKEFLYTYNMGRQGSLTNGG